MITASQYATMHVFRARANHERRHLYGPCKEIHEPERGTMRGRPPSLELANRRGTSAQCSYYGPRHQPCVQSSDNFPDSHRCVYGIGRLFVDKLTTVVHFPTIWSRAGF